MPTHTGRTELPCASFSTTMGMLVTGSIIRPRIFISTSIAPPCEKDYPAADCVQTPIKLAGPAPVMLMETYCPKRLGSVEEKFTMRLLEVRPSHCPDFLDAPSTRTSSVCPMTA